METPNIFGGQASRSAAGTGFQQQRTLTFYRFAGPVALVLLPFIAKTLLLHPERLAIAVWALVLVVSAGINGIFARLKGTIPVPPIIVAIATVGAVGTTTQRLGLDGLVWTYPALVMLHFLLERRLALLVNTALLVGSTALVGAHAEIEVTARVFASLFVSIVFLNLFTGIIAELQKGLEQAAATDALTGTYNRRRLDKTLGDAIERRKRYGAAATLLLLDIDFFKRINDELGHEEGDAVLRAVAGVMRANVRQLDVLFRIGGEEFLVLLPDTVQAGARQVGEKLCAALASAPLCRDGRRVTASIGVCELGEGETVDQWMVRCDAALYRAKREGRNRVIEADAARATVSRDERTGSRDQDA